MVRVSTFDDGGPADRVHNRLADRKCHVSATPFQGSIIPRQIAYLRCKVCPGQRAIGALTNARSRAFADAEPTSSRRRPSSHPAPTIVRIRPCSQAMSCVRTPRLTARGRLRAAPPAGRTRGVRGEHSSEGTPISQPSYPHVKTPNRGLRRGRWALLPGSGRSRSSSRQHPV